MRHAKMVGHRISASSPQGRFREGAFVIDGRTLQSVDAWGKHLLHTYDNGRILHIHLGMQGKFLEVTAPSAARSFARLRLVCEPASEVWELVAPSSCEILDPARYKRLLNSLGPDPLRSDYDAEEAWRRINTSGKPIGSALMDQRLISGVGNIFRAEVLFATKLHPLTPSAAISHEQFTQLSQALQAMMRRAVATGQIEHHFAYRQHTCRQCGTRIEAQTLEGRTSYACPKCQPRIE